MVGCPLKAARPFAWRKSRSDMSTEPVDGEGGREGGVSGRKMGRREGGREGGRGRRTVVVVVHLTVRRHALEEEGDLLDRLHLKRERIEEGRRKRVV